jgi:hypothetical protein
MNELFQAAIAAVKEKEKRLKSELQVEAQPSNDNVVNVITTDVWDFDDVEVPDVLLL